MTIKELMEELNNIFKDIEIATDTIDGHAVIFGLSDTRLSDCYGCDRLFSEDELVVSVWNDHSYCEKCLADLNAEYKAHGYTYDEDTGVARDNEGNVIND